MFLMEGNQTLLKWDHTHTGKKFCVNIMERKEYDKQGNREDKPNIHVTCRFFEASFFKKEIFFLIWSRL